MVTSNRGNNLWKYDFCYLCYLSQKKEVTGWNICIARMLPLLPLLPIRNKHSKEIEPIVNVNKDLSRPVNRNIKYI